MGEEGSKEVVEEVIKGGKEGKAKAKTTKNKSLISTLMFLCGVIVLLVALSIGGIGVLSIQSMNNNTFKTYEEAVYDGARTEIKSQVQATIAVCQSEYDLAKAGKKTMEQAKYDAKETIRIMRYRDDSTGYFWIDDKDYILVMHPVLVQNEGKNRYDLTDPNGVKIIQTILKSCQSADKGGFNEFSFTKADGVTVAPKLAYSQYFEPWGWAISTGNYIDDIQADMSHEQSVLAESGFKSTVRMLAVSILGVIVALVISFFYGKRIVAPLKEINTFAQKLSEGDMTAQINVKQNNEIGRTASALNLAKDNIRNLVISISGITNVLNQAIENFDKTFDNMRGSIDEVATAVDSIANNVTEQANSTNDASGEVSVIAEKISNTDKEVLELNSHAKSMKELSETSMETLKKLIDVNSKTRDNIATMYQQTEITNQSVQQITVAADLITGISEQTSLLALNANIEAAKAGEFGRGFAVVADEIGKLSQQSTESVEEIKKVLETLAINSEKSVEIMESINKSVDMQVQSLADTQKVFGSLYDELDKCVNSVQAIEVMTGDIDRQRVGVTDALSVLNNLAQDNAAVTEETAAMSVALSDVVDNSDKIVKELEEEMHELNENVNKFVV